MTENANTAKTANRLLFSSFFDSKYKPIFEVDRTQQEIVETKINKNLPITQTTYQDDSQIIMNSDGSITTRITRYYTDKIIKVTTTNYTTVIVSKITYSDGSTHTEYSEPLENTTSQEKIKTINRQEIISEIKEPISETSQKEWNWWKDNSGWHLISDRNRLQRKSLHTQCLKVNRIYERFFKTKRSIEIENLLAVLEQAAIDLIDSGKWNRVENYYKFQSIMSQTIQKIRSKHKS